MGEQFNIGKGEGTVENAPSSLADKLLSREQLAQLTDGADGALIKRVAEMGESFEKTLQAAFDIINPIVSRINTLPAEHKQQLVASVTDMHGPGYDLVRNHCA